MFVRNARSVQSTSPSLFTSPATPVAMGVAMTMPEVPSLNEVANTITPELLRAGVPKVLTAFPVIASSVEMSSSDGVKRPVPACVFGSGLPAITSLKTNVPASLRAGRVKPVTPQSVLPLMIVLVPQQSDVVVQMALERSLALKTARVCDTTRIVDGGVVSMVAATATISRLGGDGLGGDEVLGGGINAGKDNGSRIVDLRVVELPENIRFDESRVCEDAFSLIGIKILERGKGGRKHHSSCVVDPDPVFEVANRK